MRKSILFLFVILVFGVGYSWTQSRDQEAPVIRTTVDVVNVFCTVRDRRGNYIMDLKREDFEILEDGVRQTIDFFHNETGENAQPLTVVLLIDTSGSVKDKLRFEQMAAAEFLSQTLRKNKDMAAVVQFDSDLALVQDFTYDYSVLENAINSIRAGGATKLYDAIWVSVDELLRHEVGRKVMIILSDGADTQSTVRDEEAIRIAQEEDVVIYGIGVRSRRFDSDFGKLEKFAKSTGGLFFNSKADLERLREAFTKINQGIKNQYNLGYVSTNRKQNGSFRGIELKVKRPRLKVTHRKGYYAPKGDS
ncbi:VWA domain-containing protein [Acidobacteria bacterium AH-259-D05]|nr:VWA domain-containing protein [Acidobacteria bacterium AH-259-D05]